MKRNEIAKLNSAQAATNRFGIGMLTPTLIVLLVMTAYPLIFTFVYSFTDYNYLKGTENASFVLFDNYVSLFKNGYFQQAVWNTIKFTILAVVLEMALGLLIAVFVNSLKRGQKIMRTLLLLPYLLPAVTVALSWRMMLSANYGIINQFLKGLGLPVFNWFMDTKTAFGTILLIDVWQNVPFVFLLLYASLQSVSENQYEAARIDGASHLKVLFSIVLPLSKAILAVMVLYYGVGVWNGWFWASAILRDREMYPLQLVLREILLQNSTSNMTGGTGVGDVESVAATVKYATIMVATVPILCIYPFLQKYFAAGVMVGAVKE